MISTMNIYNALEFQSVFYFGAYQNVRFLCNLLGSSVLAEFSLREIAYMFPEFSCVKRI